MVTSRHPQGDPPSLALGRPQHPARVTHSPDGKPRVCGVFHDQPTITVVPPEQIANARGCPVPTDLGQRSVRRPRQPSPDTRFPTKRASRQSPAPATLPLRAEPRHLKLKRRRLACFDQRSRGLTDEGPPSCSTRGLRRIGTAASPAQATPSRQRCLGGPDHGVAMVDRLRGRRPCRVDAVAKVRPVALRNHGAVEGQDLVQSPPFWFR